MALLSGFAPSQLSNASSGPSPSLMPSHGSKSGQPISKIAIKFEEVFYNKAKEPYRVICIEHSTTGPSDREGEVARLVALKTFDDCKRYLMSDPVARFVITKMETSALLDFVAEFARGPRSEAVIAKSTHKLVDYVVQQLEIASVEMRKMRERKSLVKQLERVVETWTMGRVGPTIMSSLMQTFELVDREVHRVLLANQGLTLHNLHVRPELICDFSTAIEMASSHFDRVTAPVEKLYLMQDIIENIQRTIELSFSSGGSLSDNVLSSDDLIPIIVFVLLQAKPQHLNSTLYYVKNFTRTNITTSQLGFHLTTFTAAAEFIKTDHLPRSGFGNSAPAGEIAHPLDPVRSPHFDPFAAGIQSTPQHSTLQRRSTSYITPPVVQVGAGRSFGKNSSNSIMSSTTDYGYSSAADPNGYVSYGRSSTQSSRISDYTSSQQPQKIHTRSVSSYDSTPHSSGYGSQPSQAPAPRRTNYGSMTNSPSPVYGSTNPTANTAPAAGPETISLTPEESQSFFSNLKSYSGSSKRGGK